MSSQQAEQNARSATEREIHELLRAASVAASRYDNAVATVAEQGKDPRSTPRVRQAHKDLHTITMRAYRELRPEIRSHLHGHWDGEVPHGEEPPEPIHVGDVQLTYLQDLEAWQDAYQTRTVVEKRRNAAPKRKTVTEPRLLPPQACKSVIDRLAECRVELGLGSNIDAGLDEWGHFKMDFDLAGEAGLPVPCMGHTVDLDTPLHKLFLRRMSKGRDLKVIITAKNAQTGTGKTTLAFWLAHQWMSIWRGEEWQADEHATLDPSEFLEMYKDFDAGTCLIMDEAEGLDARRSMAQENVDFSHHWMKMRVRQVVSILTLPSATALDSRLQELADVWIEVENRGTATVHSLATNSYSQNLLTKKQHTITWPDVSHHPQMKRLDELKEKHIEADGDNESIDPDELLDEEKEDVAQRLRDRGMTLRDVGDLVDRSHEWVRNHTTKPDNEEAKTV